MPHPSDAPDQVFDVPEALLARGERQLVSVNEEGVHIGSDGASVHAQLHRFPWLPVHCMNRSMDVYFKQSFHHRNHSSRWGGEGLLRWAGASAD